MTFSVVTLCSMQKKESFSEMRDRGKLFRLWVVCECKSRRRETAGIDPAGVRHTSSLHCFVMSNLSTQMR